MKWNVQIHSWQGTSVERLRNVPHERSRRHVRAERTPKMIIAPIIIFARHLATDAAKNLPAAAIVDRSSWNSVVVDCRWLTLSHLYSIAGTDSYIGSTYDRRVLLRVSVALPLALSYQTVIGHIIILRLLSNVVNWHCITIDGNDST